VTILLKEKEIKPTMNENSVALFNKRLHQQHNVCNIFYMMERLKLIQKDEESCGIAAANQNHQPPYNLAGYDSLGLPDLPPRFHHVHKPKGWYVPGKNSKPKHVKSHGCEQPFVRFYLTQ
jgi:hypothetical protein